MIGESIAAAGPAGRPWRLWRRQVGGLLRLELGKVLFSRWALVGWALAFLPVLVMAARVAVVTLAPPRGLAPAMDEGAYALLYQTLLLRLCLFFGCLAIFINLIRGELQQRTLHYYLLAPLRREVLVGGKFLGGWLGAACLFGGAALVTRLLMRLPYAASDPLAAVLNGPWLRLSLAYLAVTLLACLCYGALFHLIGILPLNPIGPAIFLFAWESVNLFLPAVLKPFSVVYYLEALLPVPLDLGPVAILARPPPPPLALAGALALAAACLALAMWRGRRLELGYGED